MHLFSKLGVDPKRMSAIGYGEYQLLGPNDSEAGRQGNRRVAVVILSSRHERQMQGQADAN
ncbi:MAG: hypothetical protein AB2807_02190 [Candidatus Sedimenticola endophacoides]